MAPPNAQEIAEATTALDDALCAYSRALYRTGIVVDWYVIAEIVADDVHRPMVAESASMTPWKREGFVRFISRAFGIIS